MKKPTLFAVYLLSATAIFAIGYHLALNWEFPNTRLLELPTRYGELSVGSTYLLVMLSITLALLVTAGAQNYHEISSLEKDHKA